MIFLILYFVLGILVGFGLGSYLIYSAKHSLDLGDDIPITTIVSLVAGLVWPISLVYLLTALMFKGVEKYKSLVEEKNYQEEKRKEEEEHRINVSNHIDQYQHKINLLLFDRASYEAKGWTKEDYEKYCKDVDTLAIEISKSAPYSLHLDRHEVTNQLSYLKSIGS